jgi:hypothetical protein
MAQALSKRMFPTHRNHLQMYRQMVSAINRRLRTVETLMSEGTFSAIVPKSVPGRAGKLYGRAFLNLASTYQNRLVQLSRADSQKLRHPENVDRMDCRTHFLEHFRKATEGKAKIHGSDTLFPHELVKKALEESLTSEEEDQVNAIWRTMVEKAKAGGGLGNSIFMCDFSGSMQRSACGDLPYWVSLAIGLLGSEVCSEGFRNQILTFDSQPTLHTFPEGNLCTRLASIRGNLALGQGWSTDFQAAMNLVIATLKERRVQPGQEPENLIVLTDMEWDAACGSNQISAYTDVSYENHVKTEVWQTHVEMIKETFRRTGEEMWGTVESGGLGGFKVPRIVIWNLAARTTNVAAFHATKDTPGVSMLSGWSPTQFQVLQTLGPQQVSAMETLEEELNDPQYEELTCFLRWRF